MPSIINASTSGAGGLISTADASGVLQLQTAGTTAVTIDASQNVGIGGTPTDFGAGYKTLAVSATQGAYYGAESTTGSHSAFFYMENGYGGVGTITSSTFAITTNGEERIRVAANGNVGVNIDPTANLHLKAGTATASTAPLKLTAGTSLTTAEAGAVEYDGVAKYFTGNTVSGRGYNPTTQIFRLAANGAAIGPAINNFFGANSAINLAGGGVYEIEAYCYFLKSTNGTAIVTATTSLAPVNLSGTVQYGAAAGGLASGAANQISLFNSTSTAAAFGQSVSLVSGANHAFIIRLIVEANASPSNLRINFAASAGSMTPLRTSYYKVTRLPASNTGSFAA